MKKRQIFTIILVPIILFLSWRLYAGIKEHIDTAAEVKRSESRVIEKMKMIREAEKAFLQANGRYTANWDSLITFVKEGKLPNVQKREKIIKRAAEFNHLGDSVQVSYDTLGMDSAKDRLFPADKFPNLNLDELSYLPSPKDGMPIDRAKQFILTAGKLKLEKVLVPVDVIEVVDPFPIDKMRKDDSNNRKRRFLRFGSMEEVTLSGNWED